MFRTLTPIFSLLIAIAIFFFFIKPTMQEVGAIQDETNGYREAVEQAAEFNGYLNSLITEKDSIGARERERLEALVPDEIDEIRTIIDLKEVAETHELVFGDISVELAHASDSGVDSGVVENTEGISSSDFSTSNLGFNVIGTYEQLRTFLADLERSLFLMEITELNFDTTEGDLVQFEFRVRSHALKPQFGVGAANSNFDPTI